MTPRTPTPPVPPGPTPAGPPAARRGATPAQEFAPPSVCGGAHRRVGALRGDTGAAGVEVLAAGLVVLVAGILLATSAWGIVDARIALVAAAREAAHVYVESTHPEVAASRARHAAAQTLAGFGRDPARAQVSIVGSMRRCEPVVVEVSYRAPVVSGPILGELGSGLDLRVRHSQVVDPFRSHLPGGAQCTA